MISKEQKNKIIKLACGIMSTNEEFMLGKFLSNISEQFNGEVIGIDFGSTDKTREIMDKYCKHVETHEWIRDFGKAKNMLIEIAEREGYDWLFILDSDENLTKGSVKSIIEVIENNEHEIYYLPRLGFTSENSIEGHIDCFPDFQARLFKLKKGFHHRSPIHTNLYRNDNTACCWENKEGAFLPIFIHHYANLKPKEEQYRRILNREAIKQGLPKLREIKVEGNLDGYFNPARKVVININ